MSLQNDGSRQPGEAEEDTENNIKLQKENGYFAMLPVSGTCLTSFFSMDGPLLG